MKKTKSPKSTTKKHAPGLKDLIETRAGMNIQQLVGTKRRARVSKLYGYKA